MIVHKCTYCGGDVRSPDRLAGRSAGCPHCHRPGIVPGLPVTGSMTVDMLRVYRTRHAAMVQEGQPSNFVSFDD